MSRTVSVDKMADAIAEELEKYRELSTVGMKKAVRKAGKTVRKGIEENAPVRTGTYAKSWTAKVNAEDAESISVTVHSPSRYMIAHLLENGHAKRGGGRVRAIPHIAPAEQQGISQLEAEIKKELGG